MYRHQRGLHYVNTVNFENILLLFRYTASPRVRLKDSLFSEAEPEDSKTLVTQNLRSSCSLHGPGD